MGLLCVYAMFLIALSNIALAVLLALGPLFIALLFFDATKQILRGMDRAARELRPHHHLTVMVAALLLQIVQSYAAQTAARGSAILTVDALNMMLVAVLVFLILRQVMPIAAGLAGGVALSSFGLVSRTLLAGACDHGQSRSAARPASLRRRSRVRAPSRTADVRAGRALRRASAGIQAPASDGLGRDTTRRILRTHAGG